ncbi:MAG TPA: leucyl aminopeptidase [Anaeromyxobacteraceae bacterium]|nr:leucyl aminopeptidase [Anaeromyxobacteraceae bacterium]
MAQVELTGSAASVEAGVLAVPVFAEDLSGRPKGLLLELDRALGGHLFEAARQEGFRAKEDQMLTLHTLGRLKASRLVLLGLGPRIEPATMKERGFEPYRMAAGKASRAAGKAGAVHLALAMRPGPELAAVARAAVEGAILGAYRFERYQSKKEEPTELRKLTLSSEGEGAPGREVKEQVRFGHKVATAVNFARDLVNEAPAHCTPARLAQAAQELARQAGLRCEVRGRREIAALGMGLFLGVARGSAEEPRLVRVSWVPRGGLKARPLVLVGKAITFDSGGLSLKPTESMLTMKSDMAGSAAVLATMKMVAELKPNFPVHALLGACENMPGGRAYKPGDVLVAYNKKTVEITNTDAEGRLVLGDVLSWGVDALRPAAIVDVATLTGACVVALGNYTVGTFGPDGPAVEAVLTAARACGEDFWRMPLTEAVKENLKSDVADLKNTGERWGGAISAAHFLREFTGDVPWAHLDIAGPSFSSKERGYVAKGGTGVAVRTLVELVRTWKPQR